jgi:aminoglycoside phosphotransferase family enzyme/predicted kinase
MELDRLLKALSDPAAYPDAAGPVELRQTHVSAVFLAGRFAYKVKKPVSFGFLDFSTPERRLHFCREEVRLNRRLAPKVYLGVVPVTRDGSALRMGGGGEPVEWAVKMFRLPDEASLGRRLEAGAAGAPLLEALGRRLAAFHAAAPGGERVAAFGRFGVVAGNARENFEQSAPLVGVTLSRAVFDRLRERTEEYLERLRPLIAARAGRGAPRDGHGDLRLDHVYVFPDRRPPDDLVVIDCIEFSERFRCADPVADLAFLAMDLAFHGRRDLAAELTRSYLRAAGDDEGAALLPFYMAYRAAVRGKVEGLELAEPEVGRAERSAALARARAHWLFALGELEEAGRRPCLVLVGGLPGTGKSTLARGLAERAGFAVVASDAVRKELAARSASPGEAIYSPEWTERTYAECLRRAGELLFQGRRVLVDATFRDDRRRRDFLAAARAWGAPALILLCEADPEVVQRRLEGRKGDISDADWSVYLRHTQEWQEPGPQTRPFVHRIPAGDAGQAASLASEALRLAGLAG